MKEKADELVEMFKQYAKDSLNESSEFTPTGNAIQCAIICVEQILPCTEYKQEWIEVLNELKSKL